MNRMINVVAVAGWLGAGLYGSAIANGALREAYPTAVCDPRLSRDIRFTVYVTALLGPINLIVVLFVFDWPKEPTLEFECH